MSTHYGLDTDYFRGKLQDMLERMNYYRPEELARELVRLTLTAHITATKEELE